MATLYLKHQERLNRYRRGLTDEQLARMDGVSVHGIKRWRQKNRLPVNQAPESVKGTEKEYAVVRAFLSDLIRAADTLAEPPSAEQIGRYMAAWREEKTGGSVCDER